MGMFNERCMVTGACLYDTTVVLLREQRDLTFLPCALPFGGRWDNYGSVEPNVDSFAQHLAIGVRAAFASGSLRIDFGACFRPEFALNDSPEETLHKLLAAVVMDTMDGGRNVTLSGQRLRSALIATEVVDALCSIASTSRVRPGSAVDRDAASILHPDAADPASHGHEVLALLDRQLQTRDVRWNPCGSTPTQFSLEAEHQALQDAVRRYLHDPPVCAALLKYARTQYFADLTIDDIQGTQWLTWQ